MTRRSSDHHRRSLRLQGYDYSRAGAYFVTICAHDRECLFGDVMGDQVVLSPCGAIVEEEWKRTAVVRPSVHLDESIVMPNHFHGIVVIASAGADDAGTQSVGATSCAPLHDPPLHAPLRRPARSLGSLVAQFKSAVTRRVRALRHAPHLEAWQRGFHDHIIRGQEDLNRHREYIRNSPRQWAEDDLNPANSPGARRLRGDP
jgi:putative transposase